MNCGTICRLFQLKNSAKSFLQINGIISTKFWDAVLGAGHLSRGCECFIVHGREHLFEAIPVTTRSLNFLGLNTIVQKFNISLEKNR